MSTRCQIQVVEDDDLKITLYRHCDGYPSSIVPYIQDTFKEHGAHWEAGRAGKVASFLCEQNPGGTEPEEGHALHGDIEFYYRVHLNSPDGQHVSSKPTWDLEIFDGDGVGVYVPRTPVMELDGEKIQEDLRKRFEDE